MTFNAKAQILDLYYVEKKSTRDIEEVTGVTHVSVQKILRRHGSGARSCSVGTKVAADRRRAANKDRDARICAMRLDGCKVEDIAESVDVSVTTVRCVLRAAGIRTRMSIVQGGA
jgi:transposase